MNWYFVDKQGRPRLPWGCPLRLRSSHGNAHVYFVFSVTPSFFIIDGEHTREWSPSIINECSHQQPFKEELEWDNISLCGAIGRNLLIENKRGGRNWQGRPWATRVVPACWFIINVLSVARSTGQPIWEKSVIRDCLYLLKPKIKIRKEKVPPTTCSSVKSL